ncbi:MAG: glycyl-radical enzyme activating protein [Candidatus Latescibacterota bacterium]|nr:MAG: glycyl-radical enzyme activating protein [Candidatus Latescibacterota bacterium]
MDSVGGLIFDIKRFAVHDGPGIRTTVFLKGCPLNCWWCHNPESIDPKPELVLFEDKCIGCGKCFEVCPQEAHEVLPDGTRVYHRERCVLCGRCVEVCYAEALVMEGREVTVEEVMAELRKDALFYGSSGGGITLSGGEPMFQPRFTLAILERCKSEGFHTALDTSGYAPWGVYEKVLPYVDLVLYDLKHMDPIAHRKYTGVSNELILENLVKLGESGVPIEVRMPIVPGINDGKDDIMRAAEFLKRVKNITQVVLLPYHKFGEAKYKRLGREYKLKGLQPPDKGRMEEVAGWLRYRGFEVHISGS